MSLTLARENPFRSECVLQLRYRPAGWTWESLLHRLAQLHYRAAIVGPEGSGKTTLLEELMPRLRQMGFAVRFHRLDEESPRFSPDALAGLVEKLGPNDVIMLDGCEQLRPRDWREFLAMMKGARGLIITTHQRGRLPTLIECQPTAELLEGIVRDLTGTAYASSIDHASLLAKHRGNIRSALHELYEIFAELTGKKEIQSREAAKEEPKGKHEVIQPKRSTADCVPVARASRPC